MEKIYTFKDPPVRLTPEHLHEGGTKEAPILKYFTNAYSIDIRCLPYACVVLCSLEFLRHHHYNCLNTPRGSSYGRFCVMSRTNPEGLKMKQFP